MISVRDLKEKIKQEEGFRCSPYQCSQDKLTIGYGFNIDALEMPEAVADLWLSILLDDLHTALQRYDWIANLDGARAVVIYDMAYQMGIAGLMAFGQMIAAIKARNWDEAARQLLDSRYAVQTPNRANRNAQIMLTGEL